MAKQPVRVQLWYDDAWNDITASDDVYVRDPVEVTHGRADESATATPAALGFTVDNRDGRYNPRNPAGALFGKIGRNTPARLSLAAAFDGDANDGTSSTSLVAPSVDLDGSAGLLLCVWMGSNAASDITLPGGMTAGTELDGSFSTSRSGRAALAAPGATGTRTATASVSATRWNAASVAIPDATFQEVLQGLATPGGADVTLTTAGATQAGWWLIAFQALDYNALDNPPEPSGGPWTLLADTALAASLARMKVWARAATAGANAVTFSTGGNLESDNHAHLFVVSAPTSLPPSSAFRAHTEVASWKPERAVKGDAWTKVVGAGPLRRLGQGSAPLRSALFRAATAPTAVPLQAYWPLEDGTDSSVFASGVGGPAMTYTGEAPTAGEIEPIYGSAAVLQLAATTALRGTVNPYTPATSLAFRALFETPTAGYANNTSIVEIPVAGAGTVARWQIRYQTGGFLTVRALDDDGAELETSGPVGMGFDGAQALIGIDLTQDGADVDWAIFGLAVRPNGEVDEGGLSGTFTTSTVGRAASVVIGRNGGLADTAVGHIMISNSVDVTDNLHEPLAGHINETAGARFLRLCAEEDITATVVGDADDTQPMGPQYADTLATIFQEIEATDDGLIFDARHFLGLTFRTGRSRYNQLPTLALDYDLYEIAPPTEPVVDDLGVHNDVTATRRKGSSARAVRESGPLNVSRPEDDPEGVGRYKHQVDLNPASDLMLPDHAQWHLHKGTVDETRWPQVTVDLVASPQLVAAVSDVDVGDRITIDNLPADQTPDQVSLIVLGYSETIESHRRTVTFNCAPESALHIAEVGHAQYGIVGSDGSTTNSSFVAGTGTSLSVAVAAGYPLWTAEACPFDILVAGVRLTVTNITGASSPQTFTVTQAPVNGVTKTIPAGSRVTLFYRSYIGL